MRPALQQTLWALVFALPSFADAIVADGTYHEFVAYTVGGPVQACNGLCLPSTNPSGIAYSVTTPWTFTGPGNLLVLDLFLSGDQYQVFDNGASLGLTSTPGPEIQCGVPLVADITCSLNTANFSRGNYILGPGDHSITIDYIQTTSVNHSGAALQLTALPEPAPLVFVSVGCGLMILRQKRRSGTPR